MPDSPTPDLVRAVRAGCNWLDGSEDRCDYPDCSCIRDPGFLHAALAELEKPSEEMIAAAEGVRTSVNSLVNSKKTWRAIVRRVLGETP